MTTRDEKRACVCTPWSHRVPFGMFRFGFYFPAATNQDSLARVLANAREVKTYLLLLNCWLVAVVPWFVSLWFMSLMLFQEVFIFSSASICLRWPPTTCVDLQPTRSF